MDSAIQKVTHYPLDKYQNLLSYRVKSDLSPMDSAINKLNKCGGLVDSFDITIFFSRMALSTIWKHKALGFKAYYSTENFISNLKSNKILNLFTMLFHCTTSAKSQLISINDFLKGSRFHGSSEGFLGQTSPVFTCLTSAYCSSPRCCLCFIAGFLLVRTPNDETNER